MKKSLLLLVSILCSGILLAQSDKPKVTVGGLFIFNAYYDSYKMVDNRYGASVSYPAIPDFDANGDDLNKINQFGLSIAQTRLNVGVSNLNLLNSDSRLFVEFDFMGSGNAYYNLVRLRHAYVNLNWGRDDLLIGQTDNLLAPTDVVPGVFTAGASSPIRILSRPIMIRYSRTLAEELVLSAAASYNVSMPVSSNAEEPSTVAAQRNSGIPGFEARLQWGNVSKLLVGVGGSYKLLRPRTKTESDLRASSTIGSASMTAYLRYNLSGHTFRSQFIYGGNLTNFNMVGGYAKLLDDTSDGDYGYSNIDTWSLWGDYESKSYKDWSLGLYAGYMENLGSSRSIDKSVIYGRDANLSSTGRVSPRLTYSFGSSMVVGAEYSLYWAKWGKTFDDYYVATENYPTTYNSRITLLFRYKF